MNDLLSLAIEAHGGLERWSQVRNLQAKVTLTGGLWRIKGRPNGLPVRFSPLEESGDLAGTLSS